MADRINCKRNIETVKLKEFENEKKYLKWK